MTYKTLTLQIYQPSRRKRDIMDSALLGYARALQALLTLYRNNICEIAAGQAFTKSKLLSLIDSTALKELNVYGVEPFKDSLKMEFAALAAIYIAQVRKNPRTKFPCAYEAPGRAEALLDAIQSGALDNAAPTALEREYCSAVSREERCHPIYFGRYDTCRDYCLLYDEYTCRFYAKLYLLNTKNSLQPQGRAWRLHLRYISDGSTEFKPSTGPERYLILPLAFGKHQLRDMKRALDNPGILHTARLTKKQGNYYLLLSMECEPVQAVTTTCFMGVARGAANELHYTVCAQKGITAQGDISSNAPDSQKLFSLAKEMVRLAKLNHAKTVMEADGGFQDDFLYKSDGTALGVAQYRRLIQIASYKLPEAGLPKPILVSAKGLYSTCPQCHCRTRRNRISKRLFVCVECGYAAESSGIGSLNLANMPAKYHDDKIPIYTCKTSVGTQCYNKTLGFELLLPTDCDDYEALYYELSLLAHSQNGYEKSKKRYAMLQKLRSAADISDVVRIAAGRAIK